MLSAFDFNIVKNPEIFEQNRLPAHSDHVCYKSEYEKNQRKSSYRMSLNGLWKFDYAKNMDLALEGFEKAEVDCKLWDDIHVPAHIQMEGYGVPHYTNTPYPWEGQEAILPGEIPTEFNPVASYVKYFTVPEEMKGMKICISFQGFGNKDIATKAGCPEWAVRKYQGQCRSFTMEQLKQAIKDGVDYEEAVKTGRMNDQMAVELFIVQYS